MRVVVTRPPSQAGELCARLRREGHEALLCPLIEIERASSEPIDTSPYDWVVVTSANGADELAGRRVGSLANVAAIGPGTAAALARHGIAAALVPRVSTQEGLVAELPRPPGRVLFAAAEEARRYLVDELGADFVPLYRTRRLRPEPFPEADLVVLASASAAEAFAALAVDLPAVSIGPQTTRAARVGGVKIVAEAASHDLEGLVAAVNDACSSRS